MSKGLDGETYQLYSITLGILMPEDDARGEQGRWLADRFFFSPLIYSVPRIPSTCDLAQAPKLA